MDMSWLVALLAVVVVVALGVFLRACIKGGRMLENMSDAQRKP